MATKELSFEATMELGDALAYLNQMASSLKDGKLVIEQAGADFVVLEPAELVQMEVAASSKKDKEKIGIELSWKKILPIDSGADLKISSIEPAASSEESATDAAAEAEEDVGV